MGLSDIDEDEPPVVTPPARVPPSRAVAGPASSSACAVTDIHTPAPPCTTTPATTKRAVDLDDLFGDLGVPSGSGRGSSMDGPAPAHVRSSHPLAWPAATAPAPAAASTVARTGPRDDVLDSLFAASPVVGALGSSSPTSSAGVCAASSPHYPLPTAGAIYVDDSAGGAGADDGTNLFDTSRPAERQQFSTADSLLEAFSRQGKKGAAGHAGRFGNSDSLEHLTRNKDGNKVKARLLALMDYYDVLGVAPTASEEEIKRSYKRKALELHPDRVGRNQTPEEAELFKTITKANEVLTDPEKRAEYDRQLRSNAGGVGGAPQQSDWLQHLYS